MDRGRRRTGARRRDETGGESVEMPRRAKRRRTDVRSATRNGERDGAFSTVFAIGRARTCGARPEKGGMRRADGEQRTEPAGTYGSRHAAVRCFRGEEVSVSCMCGGKRKSSSGCIGPQESAVPAEKGEHRTTMGRTADRTARPRSRGKTGRKSLCGKNRPFFRFRQEACLTKAPSGYTSSKPKGLSAWPPRFRMSVR